MILFCLPYAGGSEAIYYGWKKHLKPEINLYPIELKGRGKRFSEPFYEDMNEAIEDIYNTIKDEIDKDEYAFYGHSMGSLLAYELYYKIQHMNKRAPKHIFFSGYGAPHIKNREEISYNLPDDKFAEKISELGGTPDEILNNKDLLELFIPILKNDFKVLENYEYKKRDSKLVCDITILNGDKDSMELREIFEWREHTSKKCTIHSLSGNHFFINNNVENIAAIINYTL